jgi:hypothetical protein
MRPLRILTWHVHGNYLFYLSQSKHEFFLPVMNGEDETVPLPGYGGKGNGFPWGTNVHDVPAHQVRRMELDCILFQSRRNYLEDQDDILSEAQRHLPRIYLEHDPPREHPTDTRHPVDNPNVLLVHVTHFNDLMWDSGRTPTRVIEHGVVVPRGARYTGEREAGIAVVNNLQGRGRRLGLDVFKRARERVPLDLVGINAEVLGGIPSVPYDQLPMLTGRYRFFFNPIRYTSLGLAVCEAMMLGMPIVGLATTEMVTVVQNGVSGYLDTNVDRLVERMRDLLADPIHARQLGEAARVHARERFNIKRFARDWDDAFRYVTGAPRGRQFAAPELSRRAPAEASAAGAPVPA